MATARSVLLGLVFAACTQGEPPSTTATSATAVGPNPALTVPERRLLVAASIALPPEGLLPESLPDPGSTGAQLLTAYCTQCHALPSPAMHGAVDWPAAARRMWVRIDMMQGELGLRTPDEAQRMQVLSYLTTHALQVPASLPAGRGSEVFASLCSRCHALPDPQVHSPADWPTVIMRMERNMERMKVTGLTNDQTRTIVTYLRTASRH